MSKTITRKLILSILFVFVAISAVVTGFCLYFLGNKPIDDMPNQVSVQKIDDEYYLTTDFNAEYGYQFKLEQYIDGDYILIKTVNSTSNSICLSKNDVTVVAGEKYRFSACYTKEKSAVLGKFCQIFEWQPSVTIKTVDYDTVRFDSSTQTLFWVALNFADKYKVTVIDSNGDIVNESLLTENQISTQSLAEGRYKVFVVGQSNNVYVLSSSIGTGYELEITRKNQILSAALSQDLILTIICTHQVKTFKLFVEDVVYDVVVSEVLPQGQNYACQIDLAFMLKNIDLTETEINIKSLQEGEYILESDMSEIVF